MDEPQPTVASEEPLECGHYAWTIGCARCFWEMKGIAEGNIKSATLETQMGGAVLFNWHVLTVLKDVEAQLLVHTRSIDLQRVMVAKETLANIDNISAYLVKVVNNPQLLATAMVQAADIAAIVNQQIQADRNKPMVTLDGGR